MPEILIVMPCFLQDTKDCDQFVQAVESVRAQTRRDWSLFVADSGGITASSLFASSLYNQDDRLQYTAFNWRSTADVAHKVNGAASRCESKYIVVMSHDDLMYPWFLERQVALLEADPTLGFAQGHVILFGGKRGYWEIQEQKKVQDQLAQNQFAGTCVMRRDLFDAFGGYDPEMCPEGHWVGLEDFYLFVQFLRWGWGYRVVPEPLLGARSRKGQASSQLYGTPKYGRLLSRMCEKQGFKNEWDEATQTFKFVAEYNVSPTFPKPRQS